MSPKSALRCSVVLALFTAAVSAAEPPPGELSRLEGFSGLVKTGKNEYLTVYDRKVKSTEARLARITIVKEGTYAQPIEVADWKGDRPNDLESVCKLPSGELLAAESGVREGQFGRIFRLAVDGGKGEVKAVYAGAKVLESTKDGKGDDYEGMLCVPGAEGKILVVQGERGGSKPYPHSVLRWGWLDLAAGTLTFSPEGLKGLEVAPQRPLWPGTEQRDIADLYADEGGRVWAAAATDGGDSGPYRSFVYQLGKLQPGQEPPIALEKDPKPLFTVDGFKIEALAAPWTENGFLAIGTEDEEIGGVVRELLQAAALTGPRARKTMQEYRLSPQYLSRIWLDQLLLVALVISPIPLYHAFKGTLGQNVPFLVILGVAGAYLVFRSTYKKRMLSSEFRIQLDHQAIGRTGGGLPDASLRFDEVTRITEIKGDGLVVQALQPTREVGVPAAMEGYGEIRARLALLRDIEVSEGWQRIQWRIYRTLALIAFVAAAFGAFASRNAWIVAPCSLVLLAVLTWSTIKISRNPYLLERYSKARWLSVLPAVALILRFVFAVIALASGQNDLPG